MLVASSIFYFLHTVHIQYTTICHTILLRSPTSNHLRVQYSFLPSFLSPVEPRKIVDHPPCPSWEKATPLCCRTNSESIHPGWFTRRARTSYFYIRKDPPPNDPPRYTLHHHAQLKHFFTLNTNALIPDSPPLGRASLPPASPQLF